MLSLLLVLYANNKLPWIGPHQIKLLQLRRIQYPCWFVWKMASKKNVVNPWAMDPVVTDCKSEGLQCSLFHYICLLHWQISHEFTTARGVFRMYCERCDALLQLIIPLCQMSAISANMTCACALLPRVTATAQICFHCATLAQMEPSLFCRELAALRLLRSVLQPK